MRAAMKVVQSASRAAAALLMTLVLMHAIAVSQCAPVAPSTALASQPRQAPSGPDQPEQALKAELGADVNLAQQAEQQTAALSSASSESESSIAGTPAAAAAAESTLSPNSTRKLKRDSRAKVTSVELDTQETGYLPAAYQGTDSDYGYDAGKNSYGKQASDWSVYDQGNHGLYDKYGDKAWKDQGHNAHQANGKHDSYGNSYNSHGSGHGSGYYSRDRGYGYEKHYAYDREVASKQHADNHNSYGSNHGLHDYYGNSASNAHTNSGHDKYGQASRYGNHGYGKRASDLAAHHDYGQNQNKAHYYAQNQPAAPSYYPSYSSHAPTYRSTYSDYGPQIGYPSNYPSYY